MKKKPHPFALFMGGLFVALAATMVPPGSVQPSPEPEPEPKPEPDGDGRWRLLEVRVMELELKLSAAIEEIERDQVRLYRLLGEIQKVPHEKEKRA